MDKCCWYLKDTSELSKCMYKCLTYVCTCALVGKTFFTTKYRDIIFHMCVKSVRDEVELEHAPTATHTHTQMFLLMYKNVFIIKFIWIASVQNKKCGFHEKKQNHLFLRNYKWNREVLFVVNSMKIKKWKQSFVNISFKDERNG